MTSVGIITPSPPVFHGDQCPGIAYSDYSPLPCWHMNCIVPSMSTEPSVVIYTRYLGKSELLVPDTDCPETKLYPMPYHAVIELPQHTRLAQSPVAKDPLAAPEPVLSMGRAEPFPEPAACRGPALEV